MQSRLFFTFTCTAIVPWTLLTHVKFTKKKINGINRKCILQFIKSMCEKTRVCLVRVSSNIKSLKLQFSRGLKVSNGQYRPKEPKKCIKNWKVQEF